MAKPILLSVDDDSGVLRAIERDLRSQYGAEYRVIGSDSPEGALEVLKQLKVRNDNVALLLYQSLHVGLPANDPQIKRLAEALGPDSATLPVVLSRDGTKLVESVPADVAQKVRLRTRAQTSFYDMATVSGGPAGLPAPVY